MEPRRIVDMIDRQQWLGPAAETVQGAIRNTYRAAGPVGQQIKNFLHGTWLGHPLHSVLTDVPIGAWTAALAFDALEAASGRTELGPGADTAVAIGIAGAASAALAGLTDWEHLNSRPAKVGLVHATLNTTALLVYVASWALRKQRHRSAGRTLAYLGYSIAGISAYLGGELAYAQKIGVDHAWRGPEPERFTPVLPEQELSEGQLHRVDADGASILLVRQAGRIYALGDTCAHLGCSLAEGHLDGDTIICHCHGSCYSLEDGHVINGPSTYDQPSYDTRLHQSQIEVRTARREPIAWWRWKSRSQE